MGYDKALSTSVVAMLVSLALAGCQTDGQNLVTDSQQALASSESSSAAPADQSQKRVSWEFYTPLYDQGDHLKTLVTEDKKFDNAATLYLEQKQFFNQNRAKQQAMLDIVARQLNEPRLGGLRQALTEINAIGWPAPTSEWAKVSAIIKKAETTLASYANHDFLKEPEFRAAEAERLEKTLVDLKGRIERHLSTAFKSFDHFGVTPFFISYPLAGDASALMAGNFGGIQPILDNATSSQLKAFAANYPKEVLGEERWNRLGEIFVVATLRDIGKGKAGDLVSVLGAVNAAKVAGFEPKTVPDLKIAFVEVTSRTLLKKRQVEFPASVTVDLPVEVVKAELDEAFADSRTTTANYLIIFDVALAKASRRVTSTEKITSKVVTGQKTEPNPEYNIVQNEVNNARLKVQEASLNAASANAQYCYGLGCLGKALGQLAAGAAQGQANKVLSEAMAKLSATPQYVEKPIYQNYRYNKAKVKASKTMTVHYYVVDRKKNTYFKSTFDVVENKSFDVAYGIEETDPDKTSHLANADTEEDVTKWEEAASSVKLSHLTAHYLDNVGQSKPMPKFAALRDEMVRDKNVALLKFKEQTYEGSTKKDPRFDSVVVIYMGDGALGTGFFVKPDVVMTNYHVVRELQFVEMRMYGGQETFGKVLAKDVRLDLALVKVQARGKPVEFYDQNELELGSTVEVIGHPRKFEFAITRGVVSAVRQMDAPNIKTSKKVLQVQIDAATSPGNSGGPVFFKNKVVSVVSWGRVDPGSENLNFTIHYAEAVRFIKEALGEGS